MFRKQLQLINFLVVASANYITTCIFYFVTLYIITHTLTIAINNVPMLKFDKSKQQQNAKINEFCVT